MDSFRKPLRIGDVARAIGCSTEYVRLAERQPWFPIKHVDRDFAGQRRFTEAEKDLITEAITAHRSK